MLRNPFDEEDSKMEIIFDGTVAKDNKNPIYKGLYI